MQFNKILIMIKNLKYLLTLSFLVSLFSINANAQVKKGDLIDGISAVVGNEIILESDILEQQNYAAQQGAAKPINASLWMVFLIISCLSTLQKKIH